MKLLEERKKILDISQQLLAAGVIHNGAGNISIYNRESGLVAITPSAVPYEDRQVEDICIVDVDGNIVESKWKPTSETPMHLINFKKRSDVNAVIHTHAPKATIFGIIGTDPMPMVLNESAVGIGGAVPIAPYGRPGTDELAEVTSEALGDGCATIMAHHGLLTVGATIDLAYIATVSVETTAGAIILARSMGVEPIAIPDDEVKILRGLLVGYKPTEA